MPPKADSTKATPAVTNATPATAPTAPTPPTQPTAATPPTPPTGPAPATDVRVSTCVVNRGRGMHVGNAVNGKVCSYHAMHYDANGHRR